MASDNKTLGRFELVGIPPAPRGVPQVEVTFDIDANGILHVSAKDMSSGKSQQIKITAQSGLSEEEIKKAVRDAEEHAKEDEERIKASSARNNLDNLVYQTEKLLKDNATLPEGDKKSAEEAIASAKKVLEDKNASASALEEEASKLQTITHKITAELYKSAGGPAGGGDGAGGGQQGAAGGESSEKKDDDVIDADYKDVN
jgi:molecular chaperone DnaK